MLPGARRRKQDDMTAHVSLLILVTVATLARFNFATTDSADGEESPTQSNNQPLQQLLMRMIAEPSSA